MAIYHHTTRMIGRSGGGNPTKALAYITGTALIDERTGEVFDFKDKSVEEVRILLPKDSPQWAKDLQQLVSQKLISETPEVDHRDKALQLLSDMANSAEKRGDAQAYREIEFSLPRELTYEQNRELAGEYVQDQFCGLGMLAVQSFHIERCEKTGELNPHCHTFFLTRELIDSGLSSKKNRDWNERSLHENWREQWAQYANFHLKMHGHDICLDHRSYKDQGLDIEPQVKLGKGVKEQERRAKTRENLGDTHFDPDQFGGDQGHGLRSSKEGNPKNYSIQEKKGFVESIPATDRVQELRSIQLRNLYRIVRRPEVVLDIVSKHHATFMWGDVQKILGRYVDELPLFQRLESKLKSSSELITLKSDQTGQEVYTTRSQLKAEKSLVETAEELGDTKGHGVKEHSVVQALAKANEDLKAFGGLSVDQQKAICHLSDSGQLKCVVGIAGAGKTTALGVCQEIWKAEGYAVYGLAPTGKAAQNLEQSGIRSTTLHKFLKSFEEGRCQYSPNSVLVLDEAGMVDMERFEGLLGAVKQLGVKLIVVGDGAQLQPVEAGPAFRLVTNRLGKAELNTVLRQKEEWQREATILFGRQNTQAAIQEYENKGHVHIVEERLVSSRLGSEKLVAARIGSTGLISEEKSSLGDVITQGDRTDVLNLYEVSTRVSSLMYREMAQDIKKTNPQTTNLYDHIRQHQDFKSYLEWKGIQKEAAKEILEKGEDYFPILEDRSMDPTKMALLFVDKKQNKELQHADALSLLKKHGLEHLTGMSNKQGLGVDVRQNTKEALISAWHAGFKDSLEGGALERESVERPPSRDTSLMLAFSNRDVNDLNRLARSLLKESGHLSKEDFTYTIAKMVEDDFGKKKTLREEKSFSKGDRIVFTRNNYGLGVKNGSIGTIVELNKQTVQVKMDEGEGKDISFAPHLNPYFDQGWAITIHKSQGTTVDRTYLLASYEMTQNLTYVAMTRHREGVQVFGSNLDFWRPEKLPEVLSKSGEKLAGTDYLDANSLSQLMKQDDHIITRIFNRLVHELEAMGAVSKRAFWQVADHFLGIKDKNAIKVGTEFSQETVREETRAHDILYNPSSGVIENNQEMGVSQESTLEGSSLEGSPREGGSDLQDLLNQQPRKINHTLQDVYEDWKHPAFKHADFYKRVFEEALKVHGNHTSVDHIPVDHTRMELTHGGLTNREKEAIQYWNEKREPYMKLYEQKLEEIEKELESPLLSYMSNESRDLTRKAAWEDPDRALALLEQVKASRQAEKDAIEKADQASQTALKDRSSSPHQNMGLQDQQAKQKSEDDFYTGYSKLKQLHYRLENSPHDRDLQQELRDISKQLFKNKDMFAQIDRIDPKMGKLIKQQANAKDTSLEQQKILQKEREIDYGFSL